MALAQPFRCFGFDGGQWAAFLLVDFEQHSCSGFFLARLA